jgi:hypothetical protein
VTAGAACGDISWGFHRKTSFFGTWLKKMIYDDLYLSYTIVFPLYSG